MILHSIVPHVAAVCLSWATKKAQPSTVNWTCKLFTSQFRRGNDKGKKLEDSQNDSPPNVQPERRRISGRGENTWLTDEQIELLKRLRRDGISIKQIKRDHLPGFAMSALYLHIEQAWGKVWTEAEDETLMTLRDKGLTGKEIQVQAFPLMKKSAVYFRIRRLLAQDPGTRNDLLVRKPVTPDKLEHLKCLHAQGVPTPSIAKALGLSSSAVRKELLVRELVPVVISDSAKAPHKKWTLAEDDLLQPYLEIRFSTRHFETLQQIPTWRRNYHSTQERLRILRRRTRTTRDWQKWTPEQTDLVVTLRAEGLTIAQIGERLGRRPSQVNAKLYGISSHQHSLNELATGRPA